MSYEPAYKTVDTALEAVESAIGDAIADNPDVSPDDIYHDMVHSIMYDCDRKTARALSRCTGVMLPGSIR